MSEITSSETNTPAPERKMPAESCVICDRSIEDVGGRRLYAESSRGVILADTEPPTTVSGKGDTPRKSVALDAEGSQYVVFWGDMWTDDRIEKARETFLKGFHPWFCQCCGARACKKCGAPLRFPLGSDHIADDGTTSHCPIFPGNGGCLNPDCR